MQRLFFGFIVLALLTACGQSHSSSGTDRPAGDSTAHDSAKTSLFEDEEEQLRLRRSLVFQPVLDSAGRADSSFLDQLARQYELELMDFSLQSCSATALYGCPDSVWLLELKVEEDTLCPPFGRQRQFIFDAQGHLIFEDSAAQLQLLTLKDSVAPVLALLHSDCAGQGRHQVYKWQEGLLIDIFNVVMEETPLSFDGETDSDEAVYSPEILKLKLEDINKDGWKDLIFTGKKLHFKPDQLKNKEYKYLRASKVEKVKQTYLFHPAEDWLVLEKK